MHFSNSSWSTHIMCLTAYNLLFSLFLAWYTEPNYPLPKTLFLEGCQSNVYKNVFELWSDYIISICVEILLINKNYLKLIFKN
jgi:hypothetical protein